MRKNQSEENKARYKNIKNQTKKVVANSTRKEAEKELTKFNKKTKQHFYTGEVDEKRWERC